MNSYTVMLWFCDEVVLHVFLLCAFVHANWTLKQVEKHSDGLHFTMYAFIVRLFLCIVDM